MESLKQLLYEIEMTQSEFKELDNKLNNIKFQENIESLISKGGTDLALPNLIVPIEKYNRILLYNPCNDNCCNCDRKAIYFCEQLNERYCWVHCQKN